MCAGTAPDDPGGEWPIPLASLDLVITDDDGQPLTVFPCRHCADWHLHLLRWTDGCVVVREWHTATCPHLAAIAEE